MMVDRGIELYNVKRCAEYKRKGEDPVLGPARKTKRNNNYADRREGDKTKAIVKKVKAGANPGQHMKQACAHNGRKEEARAASRAKRGNVIAAPLAVASVARVANPDALSIRQVHAVASTSGWAVI